MTETSLKLSLMNNKVDTEDSSSLSTIKHISDEADKPRDLSMLAFAVTIFCNNVLGYFAYHFSASAQRNWHLHDHKTSKRHAKYALILIILGLIVGVMTYTIAISVYATRDKDPECTSSSSSSSSLSNGGDDDSTHFNQTTTKAPSILDTTSVTTTTAETTETTTMPTTAQYADMICCKHNCVGSSNQHCRIFCASADPDGPIVITQTGNTRLGICCNVIGCG